jgi:class 3 adenylate cyclase
MKESPELEALVRRLFKAAYIDHDVATVRNITQGPSGPESGLRMILVADDEWFYKPDTEYMVQRTREIATTGVEFEHIEAFEHGDAGWFAASVILSRADKEPSASRFTGVFIMEEGVWRSAQWHVSVGVPNAEAWGVEISKDLEGLIESLDESAGVAIAASSNTGTVTLMFTDVEGSTQMSESIGDAEWASLISDHMAGLRTSVENHRGNLIKTLGDGAMTAFASVTDALSCALDLQNQATELPFDIRIGLHTGDAIHADGDYIGITVNKAARITSAAEPGEVMLSSVTAEMATGRGFDLGSNRTVGLKGLAGSHRLTQLVGRPDRKART